MNSLVFYVFKNLIRLTSVTVIICSGAIHHFLFRVGVSVSVKDDLMSLDTSNGSKNVTSIAIHLILDWSEVSVFVPVHFCWNSNSINRNGRGISSGSYIVCKIVGSELIEIRVTTICVGDFIERILHRRWLTLEPPSSEIIIIDTFQLHYWSWVIETIVVSIKLKSPPLFIKRELFFLWLRKAHTFPHFLEVSSKMHHYVLYLLLNVKEREFLEKVWL